MPIISADDTDALDAVLAVRAHAAPVAPSAGAYRPDRQSPSLDEVLRRRRSVRRFVHGDLTRTELLGVLDQACAVLTAWSDRAPVVPADFVLLTDTDGVAGLADGLYRHDTGQLSSVPADDRSAELRTRYVDAPALLFVCGPMPRADSGDYGHRLVAAGAFGHTLWLSALSSGLAGSVYGSSAALVTATAHRLRPGLRHLFTVAIGRGDGSGA
jgi:hypothetical protein